MRFLRHSSLFAVPALFLSVAGAAFAAETTPLELIPVPREVKQEADEALGTAILVLPPGLPEKARIAAEEINLRLRALGATPLPIVAAGAPEEKAAARRIVLSIATDDGPAQVPHQEQGYWIDSRNPREARLVGRDEQGLLWAAVTFRRMLVQGPDGSVALMAAEVRDWPDFALRMMNRLGALHREHTERGLYEIFQKGGVEGRESVTALERESEKAKVSISPRSNAPTLPRSVTVERDSYVAAYVADSQRALDFLFRAKLNMTWLPLYGPPEQLDALAKGLGGVARASAFLAALRRVTDYARARGIAVCAFESTEIGSSPEDDKDPEISRCVLHRALRKYFCWSQDGRNRRKAEEAAQFVARAGYSMAILQGIDAGVLANSPDPAHWSRRCASCRARWSDDRAAADAFVFGLWQEAFRKYAPGVVLTFLQYPRDPSVLLHEEYPEHDRIRAYWTGLDRGLPTDPPTATWVREATQPAVASFHQLFPTRPVLAYWMMESIDGEHLWNPLFTSRVRSAKTFVAPGRRGGIFAQSASCAPMAALTAAQYFWNADSPGNGLWSGGLDVDRDGTEPAVFFQDLLPASTVELFGSKAGPALLDVFKGCVSPSYCLLPSDVGRLCWVPNTSDRMQQQYDALVRAYAGLERVWQRIETGEKEVLAPGSEPYFHGLSEQVGRTRAWASYHLARLPAVEALRVGHPTPPIASELLAATQRFVADSKLAGRMDARVRDKDKPKAGKAEPNRWLRDAFNARYYNTDYGKLLADLRRLHGVLEGRMAELREADPAASKILPLLPPDGRDVKLRAKGSALISYVPYPTQGDSKMSVQVEGLSQAVNDSFTAGLPAVDVGEYRKAGGVLRFYVNGGGTGNHQVSFWLYTRSRNGSPSETEPKGWMWVNLRDYVAIDDLEATWQLVTIPLDRLVREDVTEVVGFGMSNIVEHEVCGPLWIGPMYVALNREPVEREIRVPEPPRQFPAHRATLTPLGVQAILIGGRQRIEGRLLFGLKLDGDGSLTNVRITVRLLAIDGEVVLSRHLLSAPRVRTPWWPSSFQIDLPRVVSPARVEFALHSAEYTAVFVTSVRW